MFLNLKGVQRVKIYERVCHLVELPSMVSGAKDRHVTAKDYILKNIHGLIYYYSTS